MNKIGDLQNMKKFPMIIVSFTLGLILLTSSVMNTAAFADKEKDGDDPDYEIMDKKGKKMKMKMKTKDTIELDGNLDGKIDYFYTIKYDGKKSPNYELQIKAADGCVGGSTFDDARMKIGFSNRFTSQQNLEWVLEGFDVWTDKKSAKKQLLDETISLIDLPNKVNLKFFPSSGDDVIFAAEKIKKSVFKHENKVKKLDKQSGWKGSIFFDIPEGEYVVWTAQPAFDTDPYGDICGGFAGLGIHLPLLID